MMGRHQYLLPHPIDCMKQRETYTLLHDEWICYHKKKNVYFRSGRSWPRFQYEMALTQKFVEHIRFEQSNRAANARVDFGERPILQRHFARS